MQRSPQNYMPNTPNRQGQRDAAPHTSPAYTMAARIRNEQGIERAGEYLAAMEPFLAPGERAHIAAQLGVPLIQHEPSPPPQPSVNPGGQPFNQQMPPMFSAFGQQHGGMNDPMQLVQLIYALRNMNGGGEGGGKAPDMGGMNNPLMFAQLLGMMGKK